MPVKDWSRYGDDWRDLARQIKSEVDWCCEICGAQCRRPEEFGLRQSELPTVALFDGADMEASKRERLPTVARSQLARQTLTVHHWDGNPENRDRTNLVAVCSPCHLSIHARSRFRTIAPGQLSLF